MNWLKIACIVTLLTATAHADVKVTITGPDKADSGFALVGGSDAKDAVLRWRIDGPEGAVPPLELLDASGRPVLVFMSPVRGVYNVVLTGQVPADGLDPFGESVHRVTVGGGPEPTPDVDPTPDDDDPPVPPEPKPDEDKAPFPADSLHVLIVYESEDNTKLTSNQRAIIYGADIRSMLDSVAPRKYRIYDKDADLTHVPNVFKDAMAVPRQSLPWLVISNGKGGFSGPLDMRVEEFRALVDQYK